MPVSVAFPEIDPELIKRLGQIVINWAVIEEWLGHLLGTLIDADLGGSSVLTRTYLKITDCCRSAINAE
jgi:hypothetical protein